MVPERRREQSFTARGRPRKAGTWMTLVGGGPRPGQAHIGELVLDVWSLLGCLRTRRLVTLMDRLDRRGGLFLEWASAALGDGEQRRSGELPEDSSSFADRSTSSDAATSLPFPGREGGNGLGGSRNCPARPASN